MTIRHLFRGRATPPFAFAALLFLTSLSHAQLFGGRAQVTSCGAAVGGNVSGDVSVICGIDPKALDELRRAVMDNVEGRIRANEQTIELLRKNLDLNEGQIRAALTAAGMANVPPERIAVALVEMARNYAAMRAAPATEAGDTRQIVALRAEFKSASDRGDLARADQLLDAIEKLQEQDSELRRAATRALRGNTALAHLRYREAASHFALAAARVPAGRDDIRSQYLEQEAIALFRQGDELGDNAAAAAAIDRYRKLLTLRPRERAPLEWASTQSDLGLALKILGEREGGSRRLEEAIAAYQEALKVQTRERAPREWAMIQDNLGSALARLGEREGGTARLDQAVAAYREALKVRTRNEARLEWAQTQSNLGAALWEIGERLSAPGERDRSIARLNEAVAAFKEAIKEYTFASTPRGWGRLHNNLGNALGSLGERESGTARLDEAVAAYREALKGWTRERVPLDWAMAQNNLGATLLTLGERLWALGQRDRAGVQLENAVEAYREALKERSPERGPFDWTATQYNLAVTFKSIAQMTRNKAWLREALSAADAALEVSRANRIESRIAATERLRAEILAALRN